MYGILKLLLYQDGKIDAALAVLKENGHIYEEDGATWFRSTELGRR